LNGIINSYKPVHQQQDDQASQEKFVSLDFSFLSIRISPHLFSKNHSFELHMPILVELKSEKKLINSNKKKKE
jgi:hypothetical protein